MAGRPPTILNEARSLHAEVIAARPNGGTVSYQEWSSMIVMTMGKSLERALALTRTGESAGLWVRKRVAGNRWVVEIHPTPQAMSPMQPPNP